MLLRHRLRRPLIHAAPLLLALPLARRGLRLRVLRFRVRRQQLRLEGALPRRGDGALRLELLLEGDDLRPIALPELMTEPSG